MKLPAKIRVNGYDCRFVRDPDMLEAEGLFGEWSSHDHSIRIAESGQFANEVMEAGTVIHEWLHAMIALYNIKVPDEEGLVEALEAALVQGLRDNKTFARSIIKALK